MGVSFGVLGVVVHLILLYSIFDIYYTSPIIHDLPAHEPFSVDPPARRLFLISADGLRLDTFSEDASLAPFMRSIIAEGKGSWGKSISHVPTESRPGHVAMLAGFTEDVSAVARGWKHNPVTFDTVLNRSSQSFQWGSEDIIHLFADIPRVKSNSFSSDLEDFSSLDNWKLDQWVFDRVQEFLVGNGAELGGSSGVLFFLHLVGLDTNGHGHKPHSILYRENLRVVDDGIRRLAETVQKVFPDNRTAFVFTSDHGMTDWGSHGSGSKEEVETPLVLWGSGIVGGLSNIKIEQIDLCPLLSSLLGVAMATNNQGALPVALVSAPPKYLLSCLLANFSQLREIIQSQLQRIQRRLWGGLFLSDQVIGQKGLEALLSEVKRLEAQGRHSAASSLLQSQLPNLQQSVLAYHRVDRPLLGLAVSLSFIIWIVLMRSQMGWSPFTARGLVPGPRSLLAMAVAALLCLISSLTFSHTLLIILPLYLFSLLPHSSLFPLISSLSPSLSLLLHPLLHLLVVTLINAVFHIRSIGCIIPLLLFFFPSVLNFTKFPQQQLVVWWRIVSVCMVVFPLLPSAGLLSLPLLSAIPPLCLALAFYKVRPFSSPALLHGVLSLSVICSLLILLSALLPPSFFLRSFCWVFLPLPFILAYRTPLRSIDRLLTLSACIFNVYCLLCSSYESWFLFLSLVQLSLLTRLHSSHFSHAVFLRGPLASSAEPYVEWGVAGSLPLLLMVQSLFCTGNLASLSSFDPSSISRFVSVFSPFLMGSLLVLKLLGPLLLISLHLRACMPSSSAMLRLSSHVLVLGDLLAVQFFWQLRDSGSWLDIGLSIAHYVIAVCLWLAVHLLMLAGDWLLSSPFRPLPKHFSTA